MTKAAATEAEKSVKKMPRWSLAVPPRLSSNHVSFRKSFSSSHLTVFSRLVLLSAEEEVQSEEDRRWTEGCSWSLTQDHSVPPSANDSDSGLD